MILNIYMVHHEQVSIKIKIENRWNIVLATVMATLKYL